MKQIIYTASLFTAFTGLVQAQGVDAGPGNLVWTSSAYTASNVNGATAATDLATTNNPSVNFNVTNNPTTGSYVNGSPVVSTTDFAAGGLLIDHDDGSTGVISNTALVPNIPITGVSFSIGDIDSNNTLGKRDGVIVSAMTALGLTVYPSITAGSQLSVTGTPGEVVSNVGPNNGQDVAASQALFTFGATDYLTSINIDFANYGNVTDDQHISIGNVNWRGTTPEPSAALLGLVFGSLTLLRRNR